MKKSICLMSVILMLSACSSGSSSGQLPVKLINQKMADKCNFIGSVSGTEIMSFTVDRNVSKARFNAAEEAKQLGANAMLITDTEVTANGNSATIAGDAYLCQ